MYIVYNRSSQVSREKLKGLVLVQARSSELLADSASRGDTACTSSTPHLPSQTGYCQASRNSMEPPWARGSPTGPNPGDPRFQEGGPHGGGRLPIVPQG